jgi:Uma2 family endonuclease
MAQPAPAWHMPDFWTERDLEALPEDGHRYEILDGNLIVTPPAGFEHQNISMNLALILNRASPAGWKVLAELGIRLPGGNLIPDLVALKPGAVPSPDWHDADHVALVVEIASKSTETNDRGNKPIVYAKAGIPAYWRIDRTGTLFVYSLVSEGTYGLVEIVKPGQVLEALYPFAVTFDAADLTR